MTKQGTLFRTAIEPIRFEVAGKPVSQGSVQYAPVRLKGGGYMMKDGRPVLRPHHQNSKQLNAWRKLVASAASKAYWGRDLLCVPLILSVWIYRQRPKNHYNSRGEVKPDAPRYPDVRPDTVKLVRAIEDALTGVLFDDDARIVEHHLFKHFGPAHKVVVELKQKE